MFPAFITPATINKAKAVWEQMVDQGGKLVSMESPDEQLVISNVRARTARPKIMGLFDRTEQSYDQEKYIVMTKVDWLAGHTPEKFVRIRWDEEDHLILSYTEVYLGDVVFGYRFLVKG